jgi:hypothetical protein
MLWVEMREVAVMGVCGIVSIPLGGRQQNGFRAFLNYFLTASPGGCYSGFMSSDLKPQEEHRQPPSYEQSRAKRMANLLTTCLDVSVGAVWWVNEDILKERLPHYDQDSTREGHPCVSLRTGPARSLYDNVPMLFGTSGGQGPVVARGLTKGSPNYATSFGEIIQPARLTVWEYVGRKRRSEDELESSTKDTSWRVRPNAWKPRFNDSEMAALEEWQASHTQRRK